MRLRNLVLVLAALTVVVVLAACSSSGQSSDEGQKDQGGKKASGEQANKQEPSQSKDKQGPPKKMSKEAKSKQVAPKQGKVQGPRQVKNALPPPKNKDLQLTVPAMKEIKGDKVYLKDADGREYTYVVFKKLIVEPTDLSVLNPVSGKNIVSLQTCTLPDYTKRVIYQA